MSQVELTGRAAELDEVLMALQEQRIAEVVLPAGEPAPAAESAVQSDLELVEAVLEHASPTPDSTPLLPDDPETETAPVPFDRNSGVALAAGLLPVVTGLAAAEAELTLEAERLRHQLDVLQPLENLVPELASMSDAELATLDLATVVLVLDDPHRQVVEALSAQLIELLGNRHLLVSTGSAAHQGGEDMIGVVGCLLVVPRADLEAVESLLGADRISRVAVAQDYADRSLRTTVAAMSRRLAELPEEQVMVGRQRAQVLAPHLGRLRQLRQQLLGQAEREQAAQTSTFTAHTFTVRVWVPTPRLPELEETLAGRPVAISPVARARTVGEPPTLLRTRRTWRPYQRLVSFLSWPAPGGLDPSGLMAVTLPFLFGVMVGDVGYGVVLLLAGCWLSRGRLRHQQLAADAGRVLLVGGAWATLFGVLFGEFLGSLGNTLGMPALWFYRGGPEALEPLLLFALALGAAHVTLGLLLGIWTAVRSRQRSRLADRVGTLLVLIGLFGLAGVLARALPDQLLTPAVAVVVVGAVLACISHGALGLLLGPLELLGAVGNVLSYLRVAAVGLASVYLANVANTLATEAPLLLGLVVAVLFHTLNLALAAFSPTVQALRLHYVEFFSKFYDGGGRPFTPLGTRLDQPVPLPADPSVAARSTPVAVAAPPAPVTTSAVAGREPAAVPTS